MKDLFHGTVYDIAEIDLKKGKGYKDFGKGFYATPIKNRDVDGSAYAIQKLHFKKIRRETVG